MSFPYHGLPDWGLTGRKATVYGLDDLGEAVARLGSPVVWDRRGDVFWIETFQYGRRKVSLTGEPKDYKHALSSFLAEHGTYCMVIRPAAGIDSYVRAVWYHPLPPFGGWGHEVWWSGYDLGGKVSFSMVYSDGSTMWTAQAMYNVPEKKLYVLGPLGVLTEIASNVSLLMGLGYYHIIKVVADFDTGYYKRVILDRWTYDCEEYKLCSEESPIENSLMHSIEVRRTVDSTCELTIDTLILTQNEP